jgi:Na+:H+ antiporter, NhaA family
MTSAQRPNSGSRLQKFFQEETAGGIVMMLAALASILLNNSPLSGLDDLLLKTPVGVRVGALALEKPLLHWINDGLMAIFFFMIGLELKQELVAGALSTRKAAVLPALAAAGGMIVPALIYALINYNSPAALRGWAIPSATDIAFAITVLALLGARVPASLKVFLLAFAILDDLGAIIIIAMFYTTKLSALSLMLAGAGCLALLVLNRLKVMRAPPYVLVGIFIWVCVLKSGVHATLAGVLVAMAIPMHSRAPDEPSLLVSLHQSLHPWVAFAIVPLFAFANAGVSLSGVSLAHVFAPVPLGIAVGLVVGKTLGISGAVWLGVRAGIADVPAGASWAQIVGVAILGGIGFTMSLLIGTLAFPEPQFAAPLRIGVLGGSLIAAVVGYFVLRWATTAQTKV